MVWSTSYLDEAERCADVLLLHEGRLLHAGPPGRLTEPDGGTQLSHPERRRTAGAAALARLRRHRDVADGVVQGHAVRIVMAEGAAPPTPHRSASPERPTFAPVRAAL